MKRFENKIVIITGVNDVSREISSTFAAEGCKVVITGNEKDLEKIADEAIDKFNQIDILPNGHEAVRKEGENNNSSVQNVDYIFNTNLRSIITGAIDATDGAYNVRDSAKKVFLASNKISNCCPFAQINASTFQNDSVYDCLTLNLLV